MYKKSKNMDWLLKVTVLFLFTFYCSWINAQLLIKVSPTSPFTAGEIGISYEQSFRPKLSIEAQVGTTFSKQLIPVRMGALNELYTDAEQKNGWGVFGALSLRHYFYKYQMAPAGFYVGTFYKYRLYNFQFIDQQNSLSPIKGKDSQFLIQAIIGYQYPATDFLSFDFFIGPGVIFRNLTSYQSSIPTGETDYEWQEIRKKPIAFAPTVGVKIGFGKAGKDWLN